MDSFTLSSVLTTSLKVSFISNKQNSNHEIDENNNSQALNEAHALASLSALDDNPFVVRYYNAWIEDDKLYLAVKRSNY